MRTMSVLTGLKSGQLADQPRDRNGRLEALREVDPDAPPR
jgi:hypothetical protein